jgi:ribosomal protein L40E
MTDYTGSECPVCKILFKDDDDIVVCPECGTPYHRECYKKTGKCINTELHKNGETWKPNIKENIIFITTSICPRCGAKNNPLNFFCEKCGMPIAKAKPFDAYYNPENIDFSKDPYQNHTNYDPSFFDRNEYSKFNINPYLINFSDPLCGYNPNEDYEGIKLSEIGDYVENNTHYYLPIFKRIKETGKALTWNFTAMLFPELYFSNRKMPLLALAIFVVKFILSLPNYIVLMNEYDYGYLTTLAKIFDINSPSFQILKILAAILGYVIMFFFGGFANWIYYRHTLKKISKLKAKHDPAKLTAVLRKKGGTSGLLLALFICLYALPISAFYIYAIYFIK